MWQTCETYRWIYTYLSTDNAMCSFAFSMPRCPCATLMGSFFNKRTKCEEWWLANDVDELQQVIIKPRSMSGGAACRLPTARLSAASDNRYLNNSNNTFVWMSLSNQTVSLRNGRPWQNVVYTARDSGSLAATVFLRICLSVRLSHGWISQKG